MQPLKKYKAKRKLKETHEPIGKISPSKGGKSHFVVQKHQASHLHYDVRLEIAGVLKSWAIPKGPSLDPSEKHLAIMVEDHPLDYRSFEGTIPSGHYGAGTVKIWDKGTYIALKAKTAKENDKVMQDGLKKGLLEFILNGKKLQGTFALIKMKGQKNAWLFIKTTKKAPT